MYTEWQEKDFQEALGLSGICSCLTGLKRYWVLIIYQSLHICLMYPTSFTSKNNSVMQEQVVSPFYRCGNWGSGRWGYIPKQGSWDLNLGSLTPEPELWSTILCCVIRRKEPWLSYPHTHRGAGSPGRVGAEDMYLVQRAALLNELPAEVYTAASGHRKSWLSRTTNHELWTT